MNRKISEIEKALLRRLVGDKAPFRHELEAQMKDCIVDDSLDIIEFHPAKSAAMIVDRTLIGEGSYHDVDGVPIIISLLQRSGYLWKLDICRADSGVIRQRIVYDRVRTLGFGAGLSLETGLCNLSGCKEPRSTP